MARSRTDAMSVQKFVRIGFAAPWYLKRGLPAGTALHCAALHNPNTKALSGHSRSVTYHNLGAGLTPEKARMVRAPRCLPHEWGWMSKGVVTWTRLSRRRALTMAGPRKLQPPPSASEFVVAWQVLPVGLGAMRHCWCPAGHDTLLYVGYSLSWNHAWRVFIQYQIIGFEEKK